MRVDCICCIWIGGTHDSGSEILNCDKHADDICFLLLPIRYSKHIPDTQRRNKVKTNIAKLRDGMCCSLLYTTVHPTEWLTYILQLKKNINNYNRKIKIYIYKKGIDMANIYFLAIFGTEQTKYKYINDQISSTLNKLCIFIIA